MMTQLWDTMLKLKIWRDSRGQDMVEYALAAGFVAGVVVAFAPDLGASIINVFGKVALALQGDGGGTAAPTT